MIANNPIELLRKHYKENVLDLPSEPNSKFENLKKMYIEKPEDFSKVIAKGLNETYWTIEEIFESDLKGSRIEFHHDMPVIILTFPPRTAFQLIKKLGCEGFTGLAFHRNHFKKGSLFRGIYVILLTNNKNLETIKKHEESHILYRELSLSRNDAYSLARKTKGEKYCEIRSIMAELCSLSEILAYGITEWDKDEVYHKKRFSRFPPHPDLKYCPTSLIPESAIRTILKQPYVQITARENAAMFDKSDALPNCGIVSRHAAINILEKATTSYFEDVVDAGIESFKLLHSVSSEEEIVRIITSCGPTREEIKSGEYIRPIDEFVLWSKYWRNVIKK